MISVEGRIPIIINKNQLIRFVETQIRNLPEKNIGSGLVKFSPQLAELKLNDLHFESGLEHLTCNVYFELPSVMRMRFLSFDVSMLAKCAVTIYLNEFSSTNGIDAISLDIKKLRLNGIWSLFNGLFRKKFISNFAKLRNDLIKQVNQKIFELFERSSEVNFQLRSVEYQNALTPKIIALRGCSSPSNSFHFDFFISAFIKNINRGFHAELIDIERKEHSDQFNIAIHQIFLKSVVSHVINEMHVPVINRKVPLQLDFIKIDDNVMHVGVQMTEIYKGNWKLKLDVMVQNDTIKFSLLEIESSSGHSLIEKGVTKLLELGLEKLLKEYAEIELVTLNKMIKGPLKDVYHFEIDGISAKLLVPGFEIKHINLDQNSILLNAQWDKSFYVEL